MEPLDADTIQISRLAFEMLEFELHLLRDVVGALWVADVLRGREAKLGRLEYRAAMQRALREPAYRRGALPDDRTPVGRRAA